MTQVCQGRAIRASTDQGHFHASIPTLCQARRKKETNRKEYASTSEAARPGSIRLSVTKGDGYMTTNNHGAVTISVYHVVDGSDVHRFLTSNDRFIEHIGGIDALETRLRNQYCSFELVGTCRVGANGNESAADVDQQASAQIVAKIKEIASRYPQCVPLPEPWSIHEHRKDIAQAVSESITCSPGSLDKEIINDLLQIQMAVNDTDAVIAIIHFDGGLRAGVIQQDAKNAGFAFHDGGVPVSYMSMIMVPDPAQHSGRWAAIPAMKLSIPLMPPDDNQPLAYLVLCKDGRRALALAGRRHGGRVGWSGNSELIGWVESMLAEIGILLPNRPNAR
jgi:hypothetical protein